jgi:hypothetical protein
VTAKSQPLAQLSDELSVIPTLVTIAPNSVILVGYVCQGGRDAGVATIVAAAVL